jgi:urea carboxylase-associated protein 2
MPLRFTFDQSIEIEGIVSNTSTTQGAKAHARAQEGTVVAAAPVRPASLWTSAAGDPAALVWAETVAGGNYSQRVLARGTELRLTDLDGDACAHVLVYNALQPFERLNVADTVKVQWQVYAGEGYQLLSDQGRVLATITADTSGQHDFLYGTSALAFNEERYGDGTAHGTSPAGRELFALAAAKNGLSRRDLAPSVSFFKGVLITEDGAPAFAGAAGAGSSVTIRFEMPAIVLVANTAHPLDPRAEFHSTPLEVVAWAGSPTRDTHELWNSTPERRRAFVNTNDYLTAQAIA